MLGPNQIASDGSEVRVNAAKQRNLGEEHHREAETLAWHGDLCDDDGYRKQAGELYAAMGVDQSSGAVRTQGPSSVMAMECSQWAARVPSAVITVQPSSSSLV